MFLLRVTKILNYSVCAGHIPSAIQTRFGHPPAPSSLPGLLAGLQGRRRNSLFQEWVQGTLQGACLSSPQLFAHSPM